MLEEDSQCQRRGTESGTWLRCRSSPSKTVSRRLPDSSAGPQPRSRGQLREDASQRPGVGWALGLQASHVSSIRLPQTGHLPQVTSVLPEHSPKRTRTQGPWFSLHPQRGLCRVHSGHSINTCSWRNERLRPGRAGGGWGRAHVNADIFVCLLLSSEVAPAECQLQHFNSAQQLLVQQPSSSGQKMNWQSLTSHPSATQARGPLRSPWAQHLSSPRPGAQGLCPRMLQPGRGPGPESFRGDLSAQLSL